MDHSEPLFHFRSMVKGVEADMHRDHASRCFEEFSKFFGRSLSELPTPTFYLFDTHTSFKEHLRKGGREVAPLAKFSGMFWREPEGPAIGIFVRDQSRISRFKTFQHEVFHFFEEMAFGCAMPSWLSEGEAQYFEDAIFTDGDLLSGWIPPEKFDSLHILARSNALMPLAKLLFATQVDIDEWARLDPGQTNQFYCQSWALVSYLREHHPEFSPIRYTERLLENDEHPLFVFTEMVGQDLMVFEAAWHEWISKLEADPVSLAIDRLILISSWMEVLSGHMNIRHIPTLNKLRVAAGQYPWVKASVSGRQLLPFSSHELYCYYAGPEGERRDFEIVPSGDREIPPSFRASDLSGLNGGSVTLRWDVNSAGVFTPDFVIELGSDRAST